jgi:hypothetical protein
LNVAEAEVFEETAEVGHGEFAGSAKVYGAKKSDIGFHQAPQGNRDGMMRV